MNLNQKAGRLAAENRALKEALRNLLKTHGQRCDCLRMPCSHIKAICTAKRLLGIKSINAGPG